MNILSFVLLLLAFTLSYTFTNRYFMQMFQLNLYSPKSYVKWMQKRLNSVLPKALLVLATIPLITFFNVSGMLISGIIYIVLAYFYKPKDSRNPIVYTRRVIRMFVTLFLLSFVVFILAIVSYCNSKLFLSVVLALEFILSPLSILIANIINKPVEKLINKGFVKKAKSNISSMPKLQSIVIGGSFGKSSVKHYLSTLLSIKYNVLAVSDDINDNAGIIKTLRENLTENHDIFICETCARKLGDIEDLCEIINPTYGIITNIGDQNLNFFKTTDNILLSNKELVDNITINGTLFVNGDSPNLTKFSHSQATISYGLNQSSSFVASNIHVSEKGTFFDITSPLGETRTFLTTLLGEHNIRNLTGAIALANNLNISLNDMILPVKHLKSPPHRLELINNGNSILIDDSSNSNPEGANIALGVLNGFKDGVKILITPGMNNLGKKQDMYNFQLGCNAAKVCDYIILIGKKQTKQLLTGILEKDFNMDNIFIVTSLAKAFLALEEIPVFNKRRTILLENDLPDNLLV